MINVDTNILVRAYLADDEKQTKEAQEFLTKASENGGLFISSYAILEFAWVLKVKNYTRKEIYEAITVLADSVHVTVGQKDVVLEALVRYLSGKADFGDYMIWVEGEKNKAHQVKTFDTVFQKELSNKT